jgi:GTP-binding protein
VEAAGARPHVRLARRQAVRGHDHRHHSRDNDLVVNPIKGKQLTNVRASGTDEAVRLVPPIELTLEYAVEFIADDELVEVTPKSIRIRKRYLKEHERKKASREAA